MASDFAHQPVLLASSIAYLDLEPGATIIDGTLGGCGHAEAILQRTDPDGILIALDRDRAALDVAEQRLERYRSRVRFVHASFRDLAVVVSELGIDAVDGVILDLGVSSFQLDTASRGFRFSGSATEAAETPLDMRMDTSRGPTAADLLKHASAQELQSWFQDYGELPGSKRLARAIITTRAKAPLETSAQLLAVIQQAHVGGGRRHHPATQVFQALRIAVNDELDALRDGLAAAIELLRPGGRLVIIAYHSLEDRIVKQMLRAAAKGCTCPPRTPVCICGRHPTLQILTRKPVTPDASEVQNNPRARSGRLRAALRIESEQAA